MSDRAAGTVMTRSNGRTAAELLEEFEQTGDQRPFEEIVRRYAGMVYQVCYGVTRNAHDAEDAAQATFLSLAVQHKSQRQIKYVGPWLQNVAQRISLDICRSRKRRVAREERHGELRRQIDAGESALPDLDADEMRALIRDEVNKLPAKYRLPLILHYFGGLAPLDISRELGLRPKTLGVRLFRGRRMLAENLAGRGVVLGAGALALALCDAVQAGVVDRLVVSTSQAAIRAAAGQQISAGLVSGQVLNLARTAGQALSLYRLKLAMSIVFACATAMSGASAVVQYYAPSRWPVGTMLERAIDASTAPLVKLFSRSPATETREPEEPTDSTNKSGASGGDSRTGTVRRYHMVQPSSIMPEGSAPRRVPRAARPAASQSGARSGATVPQYIAPVPHQSITVKPAPLAAAKSGGSRAVVARTPRLHSPAGPGVGYNPDGPDNFYEPVTGGGVIPIISDPMHMIDEAIAIRRGTHTYTWRDNADAPVLTEVDSVRLTVRNARAAAEASILTFAPDDPAVPVLPPEHNFIGVWSFNAGKMLADGIDLTVRYNDVLAAEMNLDESRLKLWAYTDTAGWFRIIDDSFWRDTELNLIGGYAPEMQFFAVSAPEPASGLLMCTALAALLARRRSR